MNSVLKPADRIWEIAFGLACVSAGLCLAVIGKMAFDLLWSARGPGVVGYGVQGVAILVASVLSANAAGIAALWIGRYRRMLSGGGAIAVAIALTFLSARYYNILFLPSALIWALVGVMCLVRAPNAVS